MYNYKKEKNEKKRKKKSYVAAICYCSVSTSCEMKKKKKKKKRIKRTFIQTPDNICRYLTICETASWPQNKKILILTRTSVHTVHE